jgi:hypothetical protein
MSAICHPRLITCALKKTMTMNAMLIIVVSKLATQKENQENELRSLS